MTDRKSLVYADGNLQQIQAGDELVTAEGNLVGGTRYTVVYALVDGATPALDASLGAKFTLAASGDRTIAVPTNPPPAGIRQTIVIAHTAVGADRLLSLNTGAGGFRFGADIPLLTTTYSGLTDYIACTWNADASLWDVVGYVKGYA